MDALIAILPFALLFLLCPLMMLFMHRGKDHQERQALDLVRTEMPECCRGHVVPLQTKPEPANTPKEALVRAGAPQPRWSAALYWICWVALGALAVYAIARVVNES